MKDFIIKQKRVQKYFIHVFGCDMNHSDAERVASIFNELNYEITDDEKEADVLITIACSVRQKAIDKVYGKIRNWNKLDGDRKIVLTGCVLRGDKEKLGKNVDLVFDINDIQKLEQFLNGIKIQESRFKDEGQKDYELLFINHDSGVKKSSDDYLNIKPQYKSNYSAYVPIMTGCNNFCSYCAVPYTRGREVSRPENEILEEINRLVERGYKEITLLGQNVNSYMGKGGDFVDLVKRIDKIDGEHWIRFYANHPKDFSDNLIVFLKSAKHFCHYVHLPLQSGDDNILGAMNRYYTAEDYLGLVSKIKVEIPDVVLTTDIIVGFPGETDKQFENTKNLVEKIGFDLAFISEYSPRPGAKAFDLEDDVPNEIKDKRKKFLNDEVLAKSALAHNEKLVGKTIRALVKGEKKGKFKCSNAGLKDVSFSVGTRHAVSVQIGDFVNVKITKASSWGMEGELAG